MTIAAKSRDQTLHHRNPETLKLEPKVLLCTTTRFSHILRCKHARHYG
jgi:hypothetical protein